MTYYLWRPWLSLRMGTTAGARGANTSRTSKKKLSFFFFSPISPTIILYTLHITTTITAPRNGKKKAHDASRKRGAGEGKETTREMIAQVCFFFFLLFFTLLSTCVLRAASDGQHARKKSKRLFKA